jgi:hypothetical protein
MPSDNFEPADYDPYGDHEGWDEDELEDEGYIPPDDEYNRLD